MMHRILGQNSTLRRDFNASIVVFLVALPLSLGIALASGAPLLSGLIAAAVGGIVAGSLGGAPLLVSGPATGLAVVVIDIGMKHGFAAVSLVTLCAGIVQVLLGSLRVARYATAIAPAVLHGMLAGIGIIIALAQLHVLVGGAPGTSLLQNLQMLPAALQHANPAAAVLGLCTVGILLGWPMLPLYRLRVPPALVAVAFSTLVAALWQLEVPRVVLPSSLAWQAPDFSAVALLPLLSATLMMAMIASTESLLSAVAVDKLHSGPRARLDRELLGQGAGNIASGLLGGLPITGVIVRSTANIEAGARTNLSSVLHGVWVVIAATTLSGVLQQVPLAALAGLLVVVGCRLVNWSSIKTLFRHGELPVYLTTVVGVVAVNLLAGIALGIVAAVLKLFWQLTRAKVNTRQAPSGNGIEVSIKGAVTFLLVPKLTETFTALPPGKHVQVNIDALLIDHAAREALDSWRQTYEALTPDGSGQVKIAMGQQQLQSVAVAA